MTVKEIFTEISVHIQRYPKDLPKNTLLHFIFKAITRHYQHFYELCTLPGKMTDVSSINKMSKKVKKFEGYWPHLSILEKSIPVDVPLWLKFIKKLHFWSSSLVLHRGVKSYENQAISHTRPNWGANQSYGRPFHNWVHTLYYSHAARLRCELQEKVQVLTFKLSLRFVVSALFSATRLYSILIQTRVAVNSYDSTVSRWARLMKWSSQ